MAIGNEFNSSGISYAVKSKQLIAGKAVSMLKEGMLVLIGGGTTVREFIKLIPDELHACFLTANPHTSIELLQKPNIETILLGGRLSNYSQTVVSGEVFQTLPDIKADLCIMGANAIDAREGLTDSEWDIVNLKKAMIKAAKTVIVLAISEKLNSSMKLRLCPINGINCLVTELDPESTVLAPYRDAGVLVL
jgi:DeoR/GlpR family transcriptional regulator of sugar metabolism